MSSLFGALATSVSGLNAQSSAFGNISDNVANSQTVGYKRTDTDFIDYLSTSNQISNDSGFVSAHANYRNDVQGTIAASDNSTALAISGAGFFQVTQASINGANAEVLGTQAQYTRDGNFTLDKNGYLVNDASEALNGWLVDPSTGIANQTTTSPIQISKAAFAPVPTSTVALSANLPATPSASSATSSQINVYDGTGTLRTVSLQWTQTSSDTWTVAATAPDASPSALGTAQVTFGTASGNPVTAGTIGSISNTTGGLTASSYGANTPATLNLALNFGQGTQNVAVGLGNFGQSNGVTQFAGTAYTLNSITQDGVPPGAFSGVTTQANGNVIVNYDNGQSRVVAQVPLAQFANPDQLQKLDGQAFTATNASGPAFVKAAGSGGVGDIATNSIEGSNTDIAAEFTKLIVAQRAYSANTKMITTADDMLQQTIDMKR